MKNLLNLKGVKVLKKQEQKTIQGGIFPFLPLEPENCGCIVQQGMFLVIIAVDCNTTMCVPVPGLGM